MFVTDLGINYTVMVRLNVLLCRVRANISLHASTSRVNAVPFPQDLVTIYDKGQPTYHNVMPLLELFSCLNEILLILKQEVDNLTVDESSVLFLHNIILLLNPNRSTMPDKCRAWHACPLFQYLLRKFISSPSFPPI